MRVDERCPKVRRHPISLSKVKPGQAGLPTRPHRQRGSRHMVVSVGAVGN